MRQSLKKFVIVRHGQSEGNIDPVVYQRKPDAEIALSPEGERQAALTGAWLREQFPTAEIYTSPFTRAVQTAQIAFPGSALVMDTLLRERHLGDLLSLSPAEYFAKYPDERDVMIREGFYRYQPQNVGESMADCRERALAFCRGVTTAEVAIAIMHCGIALHFQELFDGLEEGEVVRRFKASELLENAGVLVYDVLGWDETRGRYAMTLSHRTVPWLNAR